MSSGSRVALLRVSAAVLLLSGLVSSAEAGHYRWTTAGPEPGFVFQIIVNPQDSDRMLAIAGFYGSMLFRTADRGLTWTQDEGLIYAQRIVQDPSRADVLYTLGATGAVSGVLKTSNGGAMWVPAYSGLPASPPVSALALAPSSPDTLYAVIAGSPGQVFRSLDGAVSWTLASSVFPSSYVGDLEVDPTDTSVLYSVAFPGGILKSTDSGATWATAGSLPTATRIVIDPANPSTLYAGTSDAGVSKSTDGGAGWTPANVGIESNYVRDIVFDPADSRKLWVASQGSSAATGGVFVTTNDGQSWSPVDLGAPTPIATAVAVDPRNPSLVYAAGSASVLRGGVHASADGGATWASREKGLSGYYSYAVAAHPSQGASAYCVSGAGVYRTDDAGAGWTLRGTAPFGLVALVLDPSGADTLYAGYASPGGNGVVKSVDGGATWATTGLALSLLRRLAISPSAPDHLLAAGLEGLFGTSDGGGLWSPLLGGDVRAAAVDPADTTILYAGFWLSTPTGDGLLRSVDGGALWTAPSGLPTSYPRIFDIAVPRTDPSHVYVAANGGGLYRSVDRGLSFAPAATGLPAGFWPSRIAGDLSDAATLFVVGGPPPAATPVTGSRSPTATAPANVFRTRNAADTWTPLPGFLPAWSVLDFNVAADGRTVYASTLSGVFQFERSFLDVPDADMFWASVDAAAMNGVTAGCGGGRFCPAAPTSRASAAVFLLRGKNGAAYAPPPASGTVFGDVAAGSPAADFIEELFNGGVTAGCGGGNYCPGASLTRAEMAVLLLRTEHGSAYLPPPATGAVFADVPADAFAAAWIEQLFAEGMTAGCGSGNFCPEAPVSRAQAAALVVRAFGLS
ncbi:MAG: WD40/YVTN/BNR-like repeat-containing protein [Thermoanaerobaculia bacterium]